MKNRILLTFLAAAMVLFGQECQAEDLACQNLQVALKTALLDGNYSTYAGLELPLEPPCPIISVEDAILERLFPSALLRCEMRLQDQGINLPDTSLQRLVFEQARWELLELEQAADVIGQVSLPAPGAPRSFRWIQGLGIVLFASLSVFFIRSYRVIQRQIAALESRNQGWLPEVLELQSRLKEVKTTSQFKEALFDLKYSEFNERMLKSKGEEWLHKPRRDRELIFMLLDHWENLEMCKRLSVSEAHLYRLRSKLRTELGLETFDQLIPALVAWSKSS